MCTYEASRKNYLTEHIRSVHDKIKKFKCDYCSYQTTSNSSLTKHVCSVHNQAKPYSCEQCNFQGTTKMSIQKHMNEAHVSVVQQDPGAFSNFQVIKVINIVPAQ